MSYFSTNTIDHTTLVVQRTVDNEIVEPDELEEGIEYLFTLTPDEEYILQEASATYIDDNDATCMYDFNIVNNIGTVTLTIERSNVSLSANVYTERETVNVIYKLDYSTCNITSNTLFTDETYTFIVSSNENYYLIEKPCLKYQSAYGDIVEKSFVLSQNKTQATLEFHIPKGCFNINIIANSVESSVNTGRTYGTFTIYNPSDKEMNELSDKRYCQNNISPVDLGDYIVRLFLVYCDIPVSTNKYNIQVRSEIMIASLVKKLLLDNYTTMTELASAMGKRLNKKYSLNNLSNKLYKETITYKEMVLIGDILGYDLEFVKRKS